MTRDRASAIRPWAATAALYCVVMLSAGLALIPPWTAAAGLVVWLAYLALQRDQRFARDILLTCLGLGFLVRLLGGLAGAPVSVRAGVLGALSTLAVACLGAGGTPPDRDATSIAAGEQT